MSGVKTGARHVDLDWLRVFAVLVLVFFHRSEIFSPGWYHIKNSESNRFFGIFSSFIQPDGGGQLMVPLIAIEVLLRWLFPGFQTFITDWANVLHYWLQFMLGFLFFSDDRFQQAISFNRRLALLIAIPASVCHVLIIPLSQSAFSRMAALRRKQHPSGKSV